MVSNVYKSVWDMTLSAFLTAEQRAEMEPVEGVLPHKVFQSVSIGLGAGLNGRLPLRTGCRVHIKRFLGREVVAAESGPI